MFTKTDYPKGEYMTKIIVSFFLMAGAFFLSYFGGMYLMSREDIDEILFFGFGIAYSLFFLTFAPYPKNYLFSLLALLVSWGCIKMLQKSKVEGKKN